MTLTGRCLCGGVRYTLSAPVDTISICHCAMCRHATGGAFVAVLVAPRSGVVFDDAPTLSEFESSPGKYRTFCARCGAAVYSRRDDLPDVLRLRAGLIERLPAPDQLRQQHRADAWPWIDRLATLIANPRDSPAE